MLTKKNILNHIPLSLITFSILFMIVLQPGNHPVSAFKPNQEGHIGITEEALRGIQRVVNGEVLQFSDQAIKEVVDANKETDTFYNQFLAELHFDNESFGVATKRLIDLKENLINNIISPSPNGAAARKDLGSALHTLQDFYSHTNWVELGNASIDNRLGRVQYAGIPLNAATCPIDPAVLGGEGLVHLTSGWFDISMPWWAPPGKCRHGWGIWDGLNKDNPSHPSFQVAYELAEESSTDFIEQILNDPRVAGNAQAIKSLMHINGTLGIVIDDTGSMGGDIVQVKTQVTQIVNSVRNTPDAPDEYLLLRFGDPDVGPPFVTQDPDAFITAVNALYASGGGDCPELSMTALLQAIAASHSDSTLFLFTDASAKDSALSGNVVASAQAKRIKITPLLTGSCSPIDPAYTRIATETGGQLFVLNHSEVSQIFSLVRPQLTGDFVSVLSANGIADGDSLAFEVPVDSSISKIVFSLSIENLSSITLYRPSGIEVMPSDSDIDITSLASGRIITINAPESGNWQLHFSGMGDFSLEATANSLIDFRSFEIVQVMGDRHEGLFSIPGQPLTGISQTGLASLIGPYDTADFRLVNQNGNVLQSINLELGSPYAASYEFVGEFNLPNQPFRVAVSGLDVNGLPYQRIFSKLFRGQTVDVAIDKTVPNLLPGATSRIRFVVRNLGEPATFQIIATDNHGFVSLVQPTTLNLGTESSGFVEVDLTVPSGIPNGTDVLITVNATGLTNSSITNSATLNLLVRDNRSPDCSAAYPSIDSIWPPNHQFVNVAILGINDPDADPTTITVDDIFQDEPVPGPGNKSNVDGQGVETIIAELRAERLGGGNGRMYHIFFTANDNLGGSCSGEVLVGVPKSQGNGSNVIDDGALYDSTGTP